MATDCTTYSHPLNRDGASQGTRQLAQRDPQSLNLLNLRPSDWLELASSLAAEIRFFDPDLLSDTSKDWQDFWPAIKEQEELWKTLSTKSDVEPHLALFLSFLNLLEPGRDRFNRLNTEHLDFYYKRILQLLHQPATGDEVHVYFNLAKRVSEQRLAAGTLLDAKKDGLGQARLYAIEHETIVNRATIAHLRQQAFFDDIGLVYSSVANSVDGLGSPLSKEEPHWAPFGHPALPKGEIGWTIGAKELLLKEGQRTIALDVTLNGSVKNIANKVASSFAVYLTGEEGWLGPYDLTTNPPKGWETIDSTKPANRLFLNLSENVPAVVPFQKEIHEEAFTTNLPLLKFVLKNTPGVSHLSHYKELAAVGLKKLGLKVWARGVRNLTLESDNGILDPAKPFQPFGPLPKQGSSFYVGNPEVFSKNWSKITINLNWQDRPQQFPSHYDAYAEGYVNPNGTIKSNIAADLYEKGNTTPAPSKASLVTSNDYFEVLQKVRVGGRWETRGSASSLFNAPDQTQPKRSVFTYERTQKPRSQKDKAEDQSSRYTYSGDPGKSRREAAIFHQALSIKPVQLSRLQPVVMMHRPLQLQLLVGQSLSSFPKEGFLRLQLQQHFFHQTYAELLALAKLKATNKPRTPNPPYTPLANSLTLDYVAEVQQPFVFNTTEEKKLAEDFLESRIQLFHEGPFGQTQEHPFLKWQQNQWTNNTSSVVRILPKYQLGGSLLIGLADLEPLQQINLLLQFAEGSENPLRTPLDVETGVKWSVLCANAWKPLTGTDKLLDRTQNWLKSGIVRFRIPPEATKDNTLLEAGLIWLKAELPAPLDRVCRLQNIHAQAAVARLVIPDSLTKMDRKLQDQALDHLDRGLPAESIKALKKRMAGIQKVEQPYPSFGGHGPETDRAYYQRVSERLRHKDRAVMIWDYEHLILEQFPEVYKVKCLSHSNVNTGHFLKPGEVAMVIIPKTNPTNAFDRLRPRAGRQLLNAINAYVQKRISPQVKIQSINPTFEPIKITAKVAFQGDVDAHFHLRVLQEDLRLLFSPWAADGSVDIQFGGQFYRTSVIRFMESRSYIDFITDFSWEHSTEEGTTLEQGEMRVISVNSAAGILVSAEEHNLSIIESTCP